MTFSVFTQIFLVQLGGAFVKTVALNFNQWVFSIGMAVLSLPLGAILRVFPINDFVHRPDQGNQKSKK